MHLYGVQNMSFLTYFTFLYQKAQNKNDRQTEKCAFFNSNELHLGSRIVCCKLPRLFRFYFKGGLCNVYDRH